MGKIVLFDHKKFGDVIRESNLKQELLAERLNISARHIRNTFLPSGRRMTQPNETNHTLQDRYTG